MNIEATAVFLAITALVCGILAIVYLAGVAEQCRRELARINSAMARLEWRLGPMPPGRPE